MRNLLENIEKLWLFDGRRKVLTIAKGDGASALDVDLVELSLNFLNLKTPYFTCELGKDRFLSFFSETSFNRNVVIQGLSANYAYVHQFFLSGGVDYDELKALLSSDHHSKEIAEDDGHTNQGMAIQNSLIPKLSSFNKHFKKAEIIYEPLSDVGGDFYWIHEHDSKVLVVLGDCVGHGMEGALVSMSVMSMLKRSFMSECLDDPLEIVYKLYNEIGLLVEGDSTLGLDTEMAFLIYDKANQSASFIGTGLNLIHRTHDNVILHKSRFVHLQNKKIEVEEIDLNYGDQITMYTDGITDLFDKAGDKKLGTRGLMNFMQSEEDSSQSQVEKFLADFRGETSPLDDQTMLILTI